MKKRLINPLLDYYRTLYRRGNRAKKQSILTTLHEEFGYHRKAIVRLLNAYERDSYGLPRPGRQKTYRSQEFLEALKRIWFASDQMWQQEAKSSATAVA